MKRSFSQSPKRASAFTYGKIILSVRKQSDGLTLAEIKTKSHFYISSARHIYRAESKVEVLASPFPFKNVKSMNHRLHC